MENALKCPFCGNNLRSLYNKYTAEPNYDLECGNYDCDLYGIEMQETVWKSLIQEKQDLEILKAALNDAKQTLFYCWDTYDIRSAKRTAEGVEKALKQVEHKA